MSLKKIVNSRHVESFNPIRQLAERISQITASKHNSDTSIGNIALSTEAIDDNGLTLLKSTYNSIESSIRTIAQELGMAVEDHQIEAATIAGIFGTSPHQFLTTKPRSSVESSITIVPHVADGQVERPSFIAGEAYDERSNRNAQLQSIVYNLVSSRQDDFGETFYPTIVINPTEVGLVLSATLFYVFNDFKRSVNGSLAEFGRKNLIRAYTDSTILKNEMTRAVPILRATGGPDDNSAFFVASTDVPPFAVDLGTGIVVTTSAVKMDTRYDLIGMSQTDELLNSGIMGPSDTLDTFNKIVAVYVKVDDAGNTSVIRISTDELPEAFFTYASQGNYRKMALSIDSDSIVMSDKTRDIAGVAPAALPELATHKIRLNLAMSASLSLDKGEYFATGASLKLTTVRNAAGQLVTGAVFNALKTRFENAVVIGYEPLSYRANSNIRQRGQLLDSQQEYRTIQVQYRSPLAAIMPVASATGNDTNALQTLITGTGIRVNNESVGALFRAKAALASYVPVADANGGLPAMQAFGHLFVQPTYYEETIDLSSIIDSKSSHERLKDIRAALVEKIRYYANEMYRTSEYKAVASIMTGNVGFKPTIIIGTDPVLANYIQAEEDLRTLGTNFDVRVVSTMDSRMTGQVAITFGVFDNSRNTTLNPLNWGNMIWSPELTTVVTPVSRAGQVSNEMIVAPRFLHHHNLPVLTWLSVSGLPAVTGKVATNFHNV